jgi:hypothetical protein
MASPPPSPPPLPPTGALPAYDLRPLQYRIDNYNMEMNAWKANNKRTRFALALLQAAVEPYRVSPTFALNLRSSPPGLL